MRSFGNIQRNDEKIRGSRYNAANALSDSVRRQDVARYAEMKCEDEQWWRRGREVGSHVAHVDTLCR